MNDYTKLITMLNSWCFNDDSGLMGSLLKSHKAVCDLKRNCVVIAQDNQQWQAWQLPISNNREVPLLVPLYESRSFIMPCSQ